MAQPVVQTIHRDPALFWWILLPITVVMILTGILRHYAMTLLQSAPKKQQLPQIRQQRSLVRGVNLRTNANVLSPISFQARKAYMVSAYQNGTFLAEPENRGKPRPNPMSDPAAMEGMMGMMKGNMAMMIPQTLIMGWINAFFSGFVISNLSWYFLTLFGLQPVYNFILGSNNAASQVTQQMAMSNPGAGMMGPEQDPDKLFLSEAENLEVLEHWWILEGIEERLVAKMAA
ncbi:transmembrane protein [Corynespora cassiicola Philippines]|uniref:ER membrane protein complex subunit 3 n=1 Tax=Corynespora cassiicola Philippines TaxID=1448308 RepID=A0A2T2N5S7_CORCC|nr:transmembrane protein [Corynespora cassiicola Philippines]